ncbi:DNA polymerase III subunit gamma/tau [Desulfogranum mediterraneum]|uniref:DNA polymerase III subunit gamma/tau n=1 Tax=Desulfogranum mediterraneum TaxID=160661 RepID=UPI00041E7516|nr:DNA polymerase III subunit gamma/tau [Desulfogranum mediterraneum]
MSYLVLARKSRPQLFSEVVGQAPIVRTLQNALRQDRVAHALIFSGVRGTGKTTLARIMAKALNCEHPNGAEPCNQCTSCSQIAAGGSVDLQEVDGASNRGIQEIRELKEKIRFMPTSSRYKIIIIDEVHMLTTEAFNALLKTLEEPPEHVYFMFATTELHKVPITILSRCQRFELKRIERGELKAHFARLAQDEGFQVAPRALEMIVREAGGSVRDGLSLLDQVFSYCGQEVSAEDLVEVLGLVNAGTVADLVQALLARDLARVYTLLEGIYSQGIDLRRLGDDLLSWLRNLIVVKISGQAAGLDLSDEERLALEQTAAEYSLESLTAMLDLLLNGLEKMHYSSYSRLALELVFIKIVQLGQVVPVGEIISRFDRLLAGLPAPGTGLELSSPGSSSAPGQPSGAPSSSCPVASPLTPGDRSAALPPAEPARPAPMARQPAPPQNHPASAPAADIAHPMSQAAGAGPASKRTQGGGQAAAGRASARQTGGGDQALPAGKGAAQPPGREKSQLRQDQPTLSPDSGKKDIRRDWDAFLAYVRERQPWISAALQRAASVKQVEGELVIQYEDSYDCTLLRKREYIQPLTEYFLDFFQENLQIRFSVPEGQDCDIQDSNGQRPHQERKALAQDPLVVTALEIFNGQLGDIRTGQRFRQATSPTEAETEAQGSEEQS